MSYRNFSWEISASIFMVKTAYFQPRHVGIFNETTRRHASENRNVKSHFSWKSTILCFM